MITLYFQYGRTALELVLKSVLGHVPPLAKPPSDYIGDFYPGSLQMICATEEFHSTLSLLRIK